jgi:hypothetical protein
MKLKNRDILIEAVADYDEICLKNSWKMKFYYRRNQHFKSCCNGYGYHSMIAGSSFKNKGFNSC